MSAGVYQYLIGDDGIRQFALLMAGDQVKSIAVFAENPADAKIQPGETVFARSDAYALSAGTTDKQEGFDAKSGYSLHTQIYKIKTSSEGAKASVTKADCTYYCFGIVSEDTKKNEPRLIFNSTRQSARTMALHGFGRSKAGFAVPLPQHMMALARMEAGFDLSFDYLKKIPIPRATLARAGIEQLLLPNASPDPLWIALDNKALAHNYSRITKKLRGFAP